MEAIINMATDLAVIVALFSLPVAAGLSLAAISNLLIPALKTKTEK